MKKNKTSEWLRYLATNNFTKFKKLLMTADLDNISEYIIYRRYADNWRWKTIKEELGLDLCVYYCDRHIYRYHAKALKKIEKIITEDPSWLMIDTKSKL